MSDSTDRLCDDLRALARAWTDEPSIAPHMANAPGYTTGTAVRLSNDAAAVIDRLRAALLALVEAADNAAMTHNIGTMDEAIDHARLTTLEAALVSAKKE